MSATDSSGQFNSTSFSARMSQKYEPYIRYHLAKVYMVLGATAGTATIGALFQLYRVIDTGIMAAILSLALLFGLHFYRDNGKNYYTRLLMLLSFGFTSGQILGPLLHYIVKLNPAIIVTALTGMIITFVSLSLAALVAGHGKYLYLGGVLATIINVMSVLSLGNIFFQSFFVQMAQIYVGVFVMAAFIVYDTQNMIEKCRLGNRDVVQHALDLFFDLLSMFRRLLIILALKEERKQQQEKRKNR